jgi:hypothetical protein
MLRTPGEPTAGDLIDVDSEQLKRRRDLMATKGRTPKNGDGKRTKGKAKQQPVGSVETGEKHWAKFEKRAAELGASEAKAPSVDTVRAVLRLASVLGVTVDPVIQHILGVFKPPVASRIRAAYEELWPLCHAQFYATTMKATFGDVAEARLRTELQAEITEATELGRKARFWMDQAERFGLIGAEEGARYREGKGLLDLAGDLQAAGTFFSSNWPELGALQVVQRDPTLRLALVDIDRMKELGTRLALVAKNRKKKIAPAEQVQWRQQVAGLYTMLETDWALVQTAARCWFELEGRLDDAAQLASLRAMSLVNPDGSPLPRPPKPLEASADVQPTQPTRPEPTV